VLLVALRANGQRQRPVYRQTRIKCVKRAIAGWNMAGRVAIQQFDIVTLGSWTESVHIQLNSTYWPKKKATGALYRLV